MLTFGQKITSGLLGSLKILLLCGLSNGADWNPMYNTKISLQISHYFSWFLPRFIMISLKFLLPFLSFQWDRLEPCTIQRYFSRFLKISHDFFPDFSWFLSSFFSFFYLFNGTDWNPVHYKDFSQYCSIFLMTSSQISLQISQDFLKFFLICLVFQWDRFGPRYNTKIGRKLDQFYHQKKIYWR